MMQHPYPLTEHWRLRRLADAGLFPGNDFVFEFLEENGGSNHIPSKCSQLDLAAALYAAIVNDRRCLDFLKNGGLKSLQLLSNELARRLNEYTPPQRQRFRFKDENVRGLAAIGRLLEVLITYPEVSSALLTVDFRVRTRRLRAPSHLERARKPEEALAATQR